MRPDDGSRLRHMIEAAEVKRPVKSPSGCWPGPRFGRRLPAPKRGDAAMDGLEADVGNLIARPDFSRRGFMMTSLVTGFTVATGHAAAQTAVTTDASGLEA